MSESSQPRRGLLRALSHRNYRLFFLGNGLSLVGTWMTNVAMAWLIYRISGGQASAMASVWLGYVAFASQAPTFLFSSICGVYVDRHNRRSILVFTQVLSLLQSLGLAIVAFAGFESHLTIILLALMQGFINALDIPARQSFVVEMVEDPADLSNAIAMNSMMFNLARLVGPAIGGFLIAATSEGVCFAIDAVSYAAVIASLLAMRLKPRALPAKHPPVLESLKEGYRYVFGFPPMRWLILYLAVGSFVGATMPTLLPLVADRLAHENGARMLGVMSSCVGLGALGGAVYLASRETVVGLGRVIWLSGIGYAVAISAFGFAGSLWIALPLLALSGLTFMCLFAGSNTMLQSMVDDHMRGRLMSFFSMAVMGTAPFGAITAGWLAAHTSLRTTYLFAAVLCATMALLFMRQLPGLRRLIRPVYVRKGIIPEVARGIESQAISRVEGGTVA
jgi:MFS family permease